MNVVIVTLVIAELLLLVALAILLFHNAFQFYSTKSGAPYVPSRSTVMDTMLRLAEVKEGMRIIELGSRTSLLNPLWYAGSVAIGAVAGLCGDRISLGFMAETERQVEGHLEGHLARLPENDARSRAILEQMMADEVRHGQTALQAGGVALPAPVPRLMRLVARLMTDTAYWI